MSRTRSQGGLTRRGFLKAGVTGAAGVVGYSLFSRGLLWAGEDAGQRPNIVFLMIDDQKSDGLGCYGGKTLTPNIDSLAKEGVKFTNAFVSAPVCTCSRYTTLTGRHASRCTSRGYMRRNPPGRQSYTAWNTSLEEDVPNLAGVLKAAGYTTGAVGKWHLHSGRELRQKKLSPDADPKDPAVAAALRANQADLVRAVKQRGFDYAANIYAGNLKRLGLKILQQHNMEWVTKGALDFIDANKERPFFLYMCTTLTHGPSPFKSLRDADLRLTPTGYRDDLARIMPSRKSVFKRVKAAGFNKRTAPNTWLDDGIGAVLKRLDALGLSDNTFVLYFNDNGMHGKGTCYDGGAHTFTLARWPARIKAGQTCDALVENIDFAPTILDAGGVAAPPEMKVDGGSFLPLLEGKEIEWRDAAFLEMGHTRSVRTKKWQYIALRYPKDVEAKLKSGELKDPPHHLTSSLNIQERAKKLFPHYWDRDQLYDIENDPGEQANLAGDPRYAEVLADMKKHLAEWLATFDRPFGEFVP